MMRLISTGVTDLPSDRRHIRVPTPLGLLPRVGLFTIAQDRDGLGVTTFLIAASRWVAFSVAVLAALIFIGLGIRNAGRPEDVYGYPLAAERLVAGESIYADPRPQDDRLTYRHAPWLAWLWVGLNRLPNPVLLWQLASLAGALYVIVSLGRLGGHAGLILAALALPLLGAVPHANVGILMTALLVWRRADPWSVGIAASLKIYPLLLCIGYIAERRWRDLAIAVGLAGVLWLPALWSGIGEWVPVPPLASHPLLPISGAIALGASLWLAWRRSRWCWLAIGAALPLGVPHYVGIEYIWVAARRDHAGTPALRVQSLMLR